MLVASMHICWALGASCLSKAKLQREAECTGVRPGDEACAILLGRMEVGQKKREAIC